ncbi:hypothetical protein ISF_08296 [Cordyceps fumosorosea ARSEF 2679]|uniref:Rhodopsin domain-containing protein n=1 Tax=Cordyceps fumosorosea (strain ARSEF 2679) TaxID=1081104 RepID=A0A162IB83_CORFA|nr:hypothetical protein ISF_08296 [Cordyceps fumosorosea ARSEF 2679]OAA54695.1 hypothetical protein ISF_08296 [Cordyceps fumosorosea ARSEF 2679]
MISPRELETPFNKAPLVRAVTAFLMVFSVLAVITRIATRLLTAGSLKLDDHTVIAATALAVAQALVVILQAANGFGHHNDVLSAGQISYILKCMYAANVLYIVTLAVTKISACMTVMNVAPLDRRRGIFSVMAVIAVWGVSAVITVLFQCQVSEPWNFVSGKCVNLPAFWTYFEIFNIATDLATIVAISELVWNIQAQKSMKSLVLFIFGSRILIAPAAICHIVYITRAAKSFSSTGETFDFWPPVIIRQVVLCLSIATACVPYLKPFLDNLESGQMRAGDALLYIKSGSGNSGNKSSRRKTAANNSKAAGTTTAGPSASNTSGGDPGTRSRTGKQYELETIVKNPKGTKTTTTIIHDDGQPSWDGQSQSSQTVLVQQSWRVDVEARPSSQA